MIVPLDDLPDIVLTFMRSSDKEPPRIVFVDGWKFTRLRAGLWRVEEMRHGSEDWAKG